MFRTMAEAPTATRVEEVANTANTLKARWGAAYSIGVAVIAFMAAAMTWAVGRASRSDLAEVHDQVVKLEKDVTHAKESLVELRAAFEKSNDKVQGRLEVLNKDAQDALKGLDSRIQALDKALTKLDQAMSDRARTADRP